MPTATRIRDHCLAPGRAVDAPAPGGGYRRLFPELDPLDCEDDALHAAASPQRPGGPAARRRGGRGGAVRRGPPGRHLALPPRPGRGLDPAGVRADAAYRYGHSQVRDRYQVNGDAEPVPLLPDLLGFRPVPAVLVVDWSYLFDLPGRPPAQRAKRIDGRLAASLIRLPAAVTGVGSGDDYASLAIRDLQRGQGVGLPSGEGAGPPPRGRAAHPRGGRSRPGRLAARDAALVLPAQGGRAPRRGRAPGPGGRPEITFLEPGAEAYVFTFG